MEREYERLSNQFACSRFDQLTYKVGERLSTRKYGQDGVLTGEITGEEF